MTPRAESAVLSAAAAAALLLAGALALQLAGDGGQARQLLLWAPPLLLAPALAAAWVLRRPVASPRRSAGALALRILPLAMLVLVPLLLAWGALTVVLEHAVSARGASFAESLRWLPVAAGMLWASVLLFGIAPASLLQYLVCRRHLRRQRTIAGGTP